MKNELEYYAIKDLKIGFCQLWVSPNDQSALRSWKMALSNEKSEFAKFPADYELWHIGTFDCSNGKFLCNVYVVEAN